jgi:hypothetical protein
VLRLEIAALRLSRIHIRVELPTLRYQELASREHRRTVGVNSPAIDAVRAIRLKRFDTGKIDADAEMGAGVKGTAIFVNVNRSKYVGRSTKALVKLWRNGPFRSNGPTRT